MARTDAVQAPEGFDVVETDRLASEAFAVAIHRVHPRQVQKGIKQHRGMAGRQDKPVAIGPLRILRRVPQEAGPQRVDHRGQPHRRSSMPRLRLLHGVDGERADRIDGRLIDRIRPHAGPVI